MYEVIVFNRDQAQAPGLRGKLGVVGHLLFRDTTSTSKSIYLYTESGNI